MTKLIVAFSILRTLLTRCGGRVIAVETVEKVRAVAMGNLPVLS